MSKLAQFCLDLSVDEKSDHWYGQKAVFQTSKYSQLVYHVRPVFVQPAFVQLFSSNSIRLGQVLVRLDQVSLGQDWTKTGGRKRMDEKWVYPFIISYLVFLRRGSATAIAAAGCHTVNVKATLCYIFLCYENKGKIISHQIYFMIYYLYQK